MAMNDGIDPVPQHATLQPIRLRLVAATLAAALLLLASCKDAKQDAGKELKPAGFGGCAADQARPYSATLSWSPPRVNVDGSALTQIAAYRVYYGSGPDAMKNWIDVPATDGNPSAVIPGLCAGMTYFAVATIGIDGTASANSAIVWRQYP